MWHDLHSFYTSRQWNTLRQILINERTNPDDGLLYCEYCRKPMVYRYDIIGHHVIPLTIENVNDHDISLNPDNVQLVHHGCHNIIEQRFGTCERKVYLVYGAPCAGKSGYVKSIAYPDDLVIDIDRVWSCISNANDYVKPERLKSNAFGVINCLLDMVKTRCGKWRNAWIIGGYPLIGERERFVNSYGAELIHIDTAMDDCLVRRVESNRPIEWDKYIRDYFERVQ